MNDNFLDLCKDIDELRAVLNEMSVVLLSDTVSDDLKILNISKKLDILIAKYFLLIEADKMD